MAFYWESDNSFDDKFRQSRYIKVLPYIGEGYFSSNIKILVLGESLYWNKDGDLDLTNCVRNNIYDYGESVRDDGTTPSGHWVGVKPFRNTAAVITGKDYHHSDHIWGKLAFHEFFQITAGKNADDKSKINNETIQSARKAFFEVINILNPQLIIAWGAKMYNRYLPNENKILIDDNKKLYKYTSFPQTLIWCINHPSRVFSIDEWRKKYIDVQSKITGDINEKQTATENED